MKFDARQTKKGKDLFKMKKHFRILFFLLAIFLILLYNISGDIKMIRNG